MTPPTITQAMIDLYDAYTHVTLDRRGLMTALARLAGGSAAAAAVMPLLESAAQAAIVAEDDKRLVTGKIGWLGADDEPMTG